MSDNTERAFGATPIAPRASLLVPASAKKNVHIQQIEAPITEQNIMESRATMVQLDHPEVKKVKPLRSVHLLSAMTAVGMRVDEVPYNVYANPKAIGTPLKFDPLQEMKGYENLYSTPAEFEEIFKLVQQLARSLSKKVQSELPTDAISDSKLTLDQKVALAEAPDTEAIGTIRTKALGWFLDSPVAMDIKTTPPATEWIAVFNRVAKHYAKALSNGSVLSAAGTKLPQNITLTTPDSELRDLDSDPSDTLTGLPLLASGEETIPSRVAMLAASPQMIGNGSKWLDGYAQQLASFTNVPTDLILGATIANRTSSFRKFRRIWKLAPGGFVSELEVKGLGSRVRNVFPIPFPINYAMAPAYKQLSTARMKIKGLWHSPEDWDLMTKDLTRPGGVIVSADYSGMDTRISPSVVQVMATELAKAGFSRFACEVLANVQKVMTIFTPSYMGTPRSSTRMKSVIPWLSGYKLTSEIDTIYGVATTLAALARQTPTRDIVEQWEKGEFTLYELGDDTIFRLPNAVNDTIDWDQFTRDAKALVGAEVKKDVAPVFLKKIILNSGGSPRMFARVIQQTFFNESRNDGNPAIVSLVGFKARIEGLRAHPWFNEFYPALLDIVLKTKFARDLNLKDIQPDTALSDEHKNLLADYAASLSGLDWLAELKEQAKYSKAAMDSLAIVLNSLPELQALDNKDRKLYADALNRKPTKEEAALLAKARSKFFN